MNQRIRIHQNPNGRGIHAFQCVKIQIQGNNRKHNNNHNQQDIKQRSRRQQSAIGRIKRKNYNRSNHHLHRQYYKAIKLIVLALANQIERKRKSNNQTVN